MASPSLTQQISAASHAALPHANPLSRLQMQALADQVIAAAPAHVLDIGCGPASLSIEIARACSAVVTAVDTNPAFMARAHRSLRGLSLKGEVRLVQEQFAAAQFEQQDAVICIGASGVFGTPIQALTECVKLTKPQGLIVFADLVWSSPPPEAFLSFLGIDTTFYWPSSQAAKVFGDVGLKIQHHCTASPVSFAEYERQVLAGRLAFAASLAEHEAKAVRERATSWSAMVEQFGKHCFGFEAYVAQPFTSASGAGQGR